ncbi:extracellular solute-binding protein [Vallitalea pronyensis]|uniref:Extracellular solute-binding protein n=1 Tax=Vallitalea pronyensis TaxID=1348613 RepID=A0A8J8MPY2_9FIRM|nr:extracellular solute-binding protein [Vallitalea pronyensis]QUI25416.1 extracellular solute-binding protein [Vallitalea pronyensis]
MRNKMIALCMVWALALTMFSGCGKRSDTNETANGEIKVQDNDDKGSDESTEVKERAPLNIAVVLRDAEVSPAEVELYKELEAETGVKINWQTSQNNGWEEKRSLLFASGDLPDAFFGNGILTDDEVLKYGSQGMLIPIEDYITPELTPNLVELFNKYPEYKKGITAPDGHIYSLPQISGGFTCTTQFPLYINKEWLEAVSMEMPTTTEELKAVLTAFKEQDANGNGNSEDEIPYSFNDGLGYASDLFGAFGIQDDFNTHIDLVEGKVIYTAAQPEYKQAIQYFNGLFEEGLIDEEAFTHDSKAFSSKLKSEERRVGVFQTWRSTGWANDVKKDDYIPVPPLVGPNGHQSWPLMQFGLTSKGSFAITHLAEDVEYMMAWVDNVYEPVFTMQASGALKIGIHIEDTDGDGVYETKEKATRENRTGQVPQGFERISAFTDDLVWMLKDKPAHMIEKNLLDEAYNGYHKMEYYPKVFFTIEEVEELAVLKTDIIGYTDEMYARWMQMGGIEDQWDAYLKKLNDMGLQRLIEIHEAALQRYNEN